MATPESANKDPSSKDATPVSPKQSGKPKQAGPANVKLQKVPEYQMTPAEHKMKTSEFINHMVLKLGSIAAVLDLMKTFKITGSLLEIKGNEYNKCILHLQYDDDCNLWSSVWARQSRGCVLVLIAGVWQMDRILMNRASELNIPGYHQTPVSSNHTSSGDFPANMQETMKALESGTFDGHATIDAKADGICIVFQVMTNEHPGFPIHEAHLENTQCVLNKAVLDACKGTGMIIKISTIGSLVVSSDLYSFIVEAMIIGFKIQPEEEFSHQAQLLNPVELFCTHLGVFITKLIRLRDECHGGDNWTGVFEGIVSHNQPKFLSSRTISGLMCHSNDTRLLFLGSSEPRTGFIPSFKTVQTVCEIPACWVLPPPTAKSDFTLKTMLRSLDQVTTGEMSEENFFSKFSSFGSKILSGEGCVVTVSHPSGQIDQFKMKSQLYLRASTFSIKHAITNTTMTPVFPIFEIVKKIMSCVPVVVSASDVVAVAASASDVVDSASDVVATASGVVASASGVVASAVAASTSVALYPMNKIAQAVVTVFSSDPTNYVFISLPEKVRTTFDELPPKKQVAIIANSPAGNKGLFDCFLQHFPLPIPETPEMYQALKNLVMRLDPTSAGFEVKLSQEFTPDTSGDLQRRFHMAYNGEVQKLVLRLMNPL